MTDNEKIILIMKYSYDKISHIQNEYINALNSVVNRPKLAPEDVLMVFKAKTRLECYQEVISDLERILYSR